MVSMPPSPTVRTLRGWNEKQQMSPCGRPIGGHAPSSRTPEPKSQAASSVNLEKNSILLALTANGDVVYGGKNIGIQGVQQLVRRMVQKEKGDELPVIVQADSAAPSGLLVRIVDECKLGGAKRVNVATSRGNARG